LADGEKSPASPPAHDGKQRKGGGGAGGAPATSHSDARRTECNRECLPEIEPECWRYFAVHSHDLDLIKESPPRRTSKD